MSNLIYPIYEQIPQEIDIIFISNNDISISIWVRTDFNHLICLIPEVYNWTKHDDGYKWHHIFHIALLVNLGWSPVIRNLLGLKRRSNITIEKTEDSPRPHIIEEGILSYIFQLYLRNRLFTNENTIKKDVRDFINKYTQNLEVSKVENNLWNKAIIEGFKYWNLLKINNGGVIKLNMSNKIIDFEYHG